jgi:anti-anti-sigma regulatory factor
LKVPDDWSDLIEAGPRAHGCWRVGSSEQYLEVATAFLRQARRFGQMPVVFGPDGSAGVAHLAPMAALASDPRMALAHNGRLHPAGMLTLLRQWAALAHADGYQGLRLVADMDWLLVLGPSTDDVVGLEVLLDRLVAEVGATVVCAYRRSSFGTDAVAGAVSAHPFNWGEFPTPQFEFVSAGTAGWRLSGEIDAAVTSHFSVAFKSALHLGDCAVDIVDLRFIDVAGMRAIADSARSASVSVQLRGASPTVRRHWRLGGFEAGSPLVRLVG